MQANLKKTKTAITPTRAEDYPEWYQQVIKAAELAEVSPTRGCMTIRPWGFAIWENIQRALDDKLKATGHKNMYFPLLIPASFLEREADHIEGFAKECAVVTHHRLEKNADGKLIPAGELEDPYIIRPTSETIIGEAFSRWIQSYRDLPLLMNQWANVFRWEMRTRMFLRTSEFLWQEGHTAHATAEEALAQTRKILNLYADFVENYLALPVYRGEKSESERFPGAVNTFTLEAMMQDKKALQAGTSHFLGQNFSRAFNIKFLNDKEREELAWTTSWGVSTRMIGGLIMTHSDDDGLVLPPRVASAHVVILPIMHKPEQREQILNYCNALADELRNVVYHDRKVVVEIDTRDLTGGEKAWSWVKKGIPFRVEVGMKEVENNSLYVGRRDREYKAKVSVGKQEFLNSLTQELDDLQQILFTRAKQFRDDNTVEMHSQKDFYEFFEKGDGGFVLAHWNGDAKVEAKIKEDLNVTIRCIPLMDNPQEGTCIFSGDKSAQQVIFAKAY